MFFGSCDSQKTIFSSKFYLVFSRSFFPFGMSLSVQHTMLGLLFLDKNSRTSIWPYQCLAQTLKRFAIRDFFAFLLSNDKYFFSKKN